MQLGMVGLGGMGANMVRRLMKDGPEAAWSVAGPILDFWGALPPRNFPNYGAGSWGPKEADVLLQQDRRHWRGL